MGLLLLFLLVFSTRLVKCVLSDGVTEFYDTEDKPVHMIVSGSVLVSDEHRDTRSTIPDPLSYPALYPSSKHHYTRKEKRSYTPTEERATDGLGFIYYDVDTAGNDAVYFFPQHVLRHENKKHGFFKARRRTHKKHHKRVKKRNRHRSALHKEVKGSVRNKIPKRHHVKGESRNTIRKVEEETHEKATRKSIYPPPSNMWVINQELTDTEVTLQKDGKINDDENSVGSFIDAQGALQASPDYNQVKLETHPVLHPEVESYDVSTNFRTKQGVPKMRNMHNKMPNPIIMLPSMSNQLETHMKQVIRPSIESTIDDHETAAMFNKGHHLFKTNSNDEENSSNNPEGSEEYHEKINEIHDRVKLLKENADENKVTETHITQGGTHTVNGVPQENNGNDGTHTVNGVPQKEQQNEPTQIENDVTQNADQKERFASNDRPKELSPQELQEIPKNKKQDFSSSLYKALTKHAQKQKFEEKQHFEKEHSEEPSSEEKTAYPSSTDDEQNNEASYANSFQEKFLKLYSPEAFTGSLSPTKPIMKQKETPGESSVKQGGVLLHGDEPGNHFKPHIKELVIQTKMTKNNKPDGEQMTITADPMHDGKDCSFPSCIGSSVIGENDKQSKMNKHEEPETKTMEQKQDEISPSQTQSQVTQQQNNAEEEVENPAGYTPEQRTQTNNEKESSEEKEKTEDANNNNNNKHPKTQESFRQLLTQQIKENLKNINPTGASSKAKQIAMDALKNDPQQQKTSASFHKTHQHSHTIVYPKPDFSEFVHRKPHNEEQKEEEENKDSTPEPTSVENIDNNSANNHGKDEASSHEIHPLSYHKTTEDDDVQPTDGIDYKSEKPVSARKDPDGDQMTITADPMHDGKEQNGESDSYVMDTEEDKKGKQIEKNNKPDDEKMAITADPMHDGKDCSFPSCIGSSVIGASDKQKLHKTLHGKDEEKVKTKAVPITSHGLVNKQRATEYIMYKHAVDQSQKQKQQAYTSPKTEYTAPTTTQLQASTSQLQAPATQLQVATSQLQAPATQLQPAQIQPEQISFTDTTPVQTDVSTSASSQEQYQQPYETVIPLTTADTSYQTNQQATTEFNDPITAKVTSTEATSYENSSPKDILSTEENQKQSTSSQVLSTTENADVIPVDSGSTTTTTSTASETNNTPVGTNSNTAETTTLLPSADQTTSSNQAAINDGANSDVVETEPTTINLPSTSPADVALNADTVSSNPPVNDGTSPIPEIAISAPQDFTAKTTTPETEGNTVELPSATNVAEGSSTVLPLENTSEFKPEVSQATENKDSVESVSLQPQQPNPVSVTSFPTPKVDDIWPAGVNPGALMSFEMKPTQPSEHEGGSNREMLHKEHPVSDTGLNNQQEGNGVEELNKKKKKTVMQLLKPNRPTGPSIAYDEQLTGVVRDVYTSSKINKNNKPAVTNNNNNSKNNKSNNVNSGKSEAEQHTVANTRHHERKPKKNDYGYGSGSGYGYGTKSWGWGGGGGWSGSSPPKGVPVNIPSGPPENLPGFPNGNNQGQSGNQAPAAPSGNQAAPAAASNQAPATTNPAATAPAAAAPPSPAVATAPSSGNQAAPSVTAPAPAAQDMGGASHTPQNYKPDINTQTHQSSQAEGPHSVPPSYTNNKKKPTQVKQTGKIKDLKYQKPKIDKIKTTNFRVSKMKQIKTKKIEKQVTYKTKKPKKDNKENTDDETEQIKKELMQDNEKPKYNGDNKKLTNNDGDNEKNNGDNENENSTAYNDGDIKPDTLKEEEPQTRSTPTQPGQSISIDVTSPDDNEPVISKPVEIKRRYGPKSNYPVNNDK